MNTPNDTIFEMGTSNLRFGKGATAEAGMDLTDLGAKRVMLLTDPNVASLQPVDTAKRSMESEGIDVILYDRVRVEPTIGNF